MRLVFVARAASLSIMQRLIGQLAELILKLSFLVIGLGILGMIALSLVQGAKTLLWWLIN